MVTKIGLNFDILIENKNVIINIQWSDQSRQVFPRNCHYIRIRVTSLGTLGEVLPISLFSPLPLTTA